MALDEATRRGNFEVVLLLEKMLQKVSYEPCSLCAYMQIRIRIYKRKYEYVMCAHLYSFVYLETMAAGSQLRAVPSHERFRVAAVERPSP